MTLALQTLVSLYESKHIYSFITFLYACVYKERRLNLGHPSPRRSATEYDQPLMFDLGGGVGVRVGARFCNCACPQCLRAYAESVFGKLGGITAVNRTIV